MAKATDIEPLILEALERAMSDPTPRKLHGTKAAPGIFLSASAAAKTAAARCLEQGLIRQVAEQRAGKRVIPLFAVAPVGIAMVLQRSPAPRLLAAMLDAAERTARSVTDCGRMLQEAAQRTQELRETLQRVAGRLQPPDTTQLLKAAAAQGAAPEPAAAAERSRGLDERLVRFVRAHKMQKPLQPLALPELFRHAAAEFSPLSIGQFHDAVRRLATEQRLRLLPYTQAMYQLAEPEYSVIVGREIMYYAEPGSDATV